MHISTLLLLASAATPEAAEPSSETATIVVTGERIARDVQDTTSSVSVTTREAIDRQAQPNRVEDILALIPNVQLGSGDQGPTIRGQDSTGILLGADAFLGGSRPRTTLQIDGRALGFNEFIYGLSSVWDVDRVEVFRGPQTTSQGRNAIAGAIFIETVAPGFEWTGRARALAASRNTYQLSGAVGGPIIDDQLAFRVAGDFRRSRAWMNYGTITTVGADITRDDYGLARLKVRATPTALPGLQLDITYSHLESAGPQGESIDPPFRNRFRAIGNGGYFKTDVDSLTARLNYTLAEGFDIALNTAVGDSKIDRFAPPGGGRITINSTDISFEGLLTFRRDGIEALGGVNVVDFDQRDITDLSAFLGTGGFTDRQYSTGVFGEATIDLFERVAVTGGLRYQRDRQDRDGRLGRFTVDYDRSFDAWLPKLVLSYRPGETATLGISARRGFNPGGTTISFLTGFIDVFEAETLWNYEAFVRGAFLDGKLTINATGFYTDFTNSQRRLTTVVTLPNGTTALQTDVNNAPEAHSYGVELEGAWTPSRRFALSAGIGLLDTRINRALIASDPIVGKQFQRAPRLTASGSVSWEPVAGFRLDAQARHNTRYFSNDANSAALAIAPSTTVDAKASYTYGVFTLSAYARNLFDEFALTQQFSAAQATANEPRELGASIEARF